MNEKTIKTEFIKLRVDGNLHHYIKEIADMSGNSINKTCIELLQKAITDEAKEAKETAGILDKIIEASPQKYENKLDAILQKIESVGNKNQPAGNPENDLKLDEALAKLDEAIDGNRKDREDKNVIALASYALLRGYLLNPGKDTNKIVKSVEEKLEKSILRGQTIYQYLGIED